MKKTISILISGSALLFSMNAAAGACDTNASSLTRNMTSKCSSKTTRPLCESCADVEFNKVIPKIETCRPELQTALDNFKGATCSSKP